MALKKMLDQKETPSPSYFRISIKIVISTKVRESTILHLRRISTPSHIKTEAVLVMEEK
jgi:hypothetical protein